MADFMHRRLLSVSEPHPIPEGATLVFANGTFHNGCVPLKPDLTEISGGILRFKSPASPANTYMFGIDQPVASGTGKDSNLWCVDVAIPLYQTENAYLHLDGGTLGIGGSLSERRLYRYKVGQSGKNSLYSDINLTGGKIPANITVLGVYSIYFFE